jgi:coenzyme F420 hydrogenase subunit beta
MTFFDADTVSHQIFGTSHPDHPLGSFSGVLATRAADSDLAARGQAGATVTALVGMALDRRMVDAAILTGMPPGERYARGFVASSPEEARGALGSRYVGAHSLVALREALDRGFERICVVGLPCQVRSVRKMALQDLGNEGLKNRIGLVIGLFCNWAFSAREFCRFIAERIGAREILGMDIPPPPANVLEIRTPDSVDTIPLEDLRPLVQAACRQCDDMTSEFADLSVGMFEGRPGWNTTILRSAAGRTLFQTGVDLGVMQTDVFPEDNLLHLESASRRKRERKNAP